MATQVQRDLKSPKPYITSRTEAKHRLRDPHAWLPLQYGRYFGGLTAAAVRLRQSE